jgi:hypothetical protein
MATSPVKPKGISVGLPATLSLRDLITIVSAAITLTLAWGVFSSRLAVLEREIVSLQKSDTVQELAVEKLQVQVHRNTAHQQDDELLIDQVFQLLRRPAPTRHASE